VEEQHHSFSVKASFDQRLSLVVFMCVCSSSFLIWPYTEHWLVALLRLGLFLLSVSFLIWQLWRLKDWRLSFMLNGKGDGRLSTGEHFRILRRTWVTPFVCMIYIDVEENTRLVLLWADMFTGVDYRHLCRLLLKAKMLQAKSQVEI
jgi:toxin CptA